MDPSYTIFEFNYATIELTGYNGDESNANQLLKNLLGTIRSDEFPNDKKIKDRYANRAISSTRRLILILTRIDNLGKRYLGRMALIKNKSPLLLQGVDIIEEIEKPVNKEWIEVSNFIVHFHDSKPPIVMIEYNHEGPRLSDLEYYLRQVGRDHKIAKSIHANLHLDINISDLDKNISNIFSVVVKVNSDVTNRANWLGPLKELKSSSGFKEVRFELSYKRTKDGLGKYVKNIIGLKYARDIITWLKLRNENIEYLDALKMEYEVDSDPGNIQDLDFIKNRTISIVKVTHTNGSTYKHKDIFTAAGFEFNFYLSHGKPSILVN